MPKVQYNGDHVNVTLKDPSTNPILPARGHFTGKANFEKGTPPFRRWGLFWRVPQYRFTLDHVHPLTFRALDGELIRPDRCMESDGGSIPPPFTSLPVLDLNAMQNPYSFYNHDSAYRYGGWYTLYGQTWVFVRVPRARIDDVCLLQMIRAENGTVVSRSVIHRMVRLFGMWCWNETQQARNRKRDGINVYADCNP